MNANEPQRRRGRQSAETAARTRQAIIEAATECFSRQGYEATSVREIAQSAHLTHGTLRHHFGSKLEIWKAVADTVLEYYQAKLMPIMAAERIKNGQEPNPLQDFKQVVRAFIEASYSNPVFAKLLMGESQTDNERAAHMRNNFLSLHQPIGILFGQA
ncbi:MAG: TetR/AcrR family transcriptional regulator, partial [Ketobacter sp.]